MTSTYCPNCGEDGDLTTCFACGETVCDECMKRAEEDDPDGEYERGNWLCPKCGVVLI